MPCKWNDSSWGPDGKRAASAGEDGTVGVRDPASGQEALTLRGDTDSVLRVAFSPDGKRIASCGKYGSVKIWDGSPFLGSNYR
jgi:WD40 repeat protein